MGYGRLTSVGRIQSLVLYTEYSCAKIARIFIILHSSLLDNTKQGEETTASSQKFHCSWASRPLSSRRKDVNVDSYLNKKRKIISMGNFLKRIEPNAPPGGIPSDFTSKSLGHKGHTGPAQFETFWNTLHKQLVLQVGQTGAIAHYQHANC